MKKPNIIILVLDALRTQNMSLYGYQKNTTPNMDTIASEGTLYKNPISSSYWTLPSTASLFTGTYTSTHYLINNGDKLNLNFVTLPEYLNKKGYDCYGLSPNPFVSNYSRLDRGFHIFDDFYEDSIKHKINSFTKNFFEGSKNQGNEKANKFIDKISDYDIYKKIYWTLTNYFDKFATSINKKIMQHIKNRNTKKPFFLYAHYTETHTPYVLPKKYRNKFVDNKNKNDLWKINQDYYEYYINDNITESEFNILRSIYDGSIYYLDKKVYEIYNYLKINDILDDTLLIITSDHGDQLGEKNLFFHVFSLYDTLIKIPLIIKYNENSHSKKVEEKIVQNTDIFPTIANILNETNDNIIQQFQGNSLFKNDINNRGNYSISELYKPFGPRLLKHKDLLKKYDRKLLSIRNDEKKYIYSSNNLHELYDIKKDPFENLNIYNKGYNPANDFNEDIQDWIVTFNLVSKHNKSLNNIYQDINSKRKKDD